MKRGIQTVSVTIGPSNALVLVNACAPARVTMRSARSSKPDSPQLRGGNASKAALDVKKIGGT